ncbi:hypothetical protein N7510_003133, partial [Penicillium lagena]|uniref:uncharacterized protein n=1 Tax=Penicillium lagena TaxID=94218 RepID=UPI00253F72B2
MTVKQSPNRVFKLNNGTAIPAIGFGTWKSAPKDAYDSVKCALQAGYRHIDTAFNYGNEEEVGRAIKDSGVPREEIFLTTKLWSTYHSRVEENLDLSLRRLGVDYVDLYLMHWYASEVVLTQALLESQLLLICEQARCYESQWHPPIFPLLPDGTRDLQLDRHFTSTWSDMEALLQTGKARSIGVANFDVHNLEVLRNECTVTPAVNQVELNPYFQQQKLKDYCDARGIHVTAYSPLGSAGSSLKSEPSILELAKVHSCDPCAIILSWGAQKGHSVIPKVNPPVAPVEHSITPSRIKNNFLAISIRLTEEEMAQIGGLEKGLRLCNPPWGIKVF